MEALYLYQHDGIGGHVPVRGKEEAVWWKKVK